MLTGVVLYSFYIGKNQADLLREFAELKATDYGSKVDSIPCKVRYVKVGGGTGVDRVLQKKSTPVARSRFRVKEETTLKRCRNSQEVKMIGFLFKSDLIGKLAELKISRRDLRLIRRYSRHRTLVEFDDKQVLKLQELDKRISFALRL